MSGAFGIAGWVRLKPYSAEASALLNAKTWWLDKPSLHDVEVWEGQDPPPRDLLLEKVRGCSGVLSMLSDKIDGSVMDSAGSHLRGIANFAVGYREAPQVSKTDNYTLVLADRGKSILMNGTSKTLTIPANGTVAFPVGTVVIIVNVNSSALSIAITTDTLTLANSTTTGTRTLAQNGLATCVKIGSTSWLISGAGLT